MRALLLVLILPQIMLSQAAKPLFVEAIPDQIQARMQVKARAAANAVRSGQAIRMQYFMFYSKRQPQVPAKPITVAFYGGTDDLRSQIASVASEWSRYGDFKFDFTDPLTRHYREWSRADITFRADVRIAFDGIEQPGFWSLIGKDGSDPTLVAPNQASLGLQGFTTSLPPDWAAIVRHEFGHALGLMHEHQMPVGGCDQDFKWQDDPGYVPSQDIEGQYINDPQGRKPGIYTLLAGYPNFWPQSKVDSNMRQLLADSQNYAFGEFDSMSIMKYYFAPTFFVLGTGSHCYSDENTEISQLDQTGIRKWYPIATSNSFQEILKEQMSVLKSLESTLKLQTVPVAK